MKKFKFLFVLALLFGVASPAFALNCKTGQSINSDECWTDVKVSLLETNVVSAGSILMYDINTGDVDRGSYEVVLTTASNDTYRVAGVSQSVIATGDWGKVLVRGQGKIRNFAAVASGERLFPSASEGKAGSTSGSGAANQASSDPIGWALATGTADSITDAYISLLN